VEVGINGFLDENTIGPIKDAGFSLYREGVCWPEVQPSRRGKFVWDKPDRIAGLCREAGLRWMPILFGPLGDSWPLQKYPELQKDSAYLLQLEDWKRFVQGMVDRYMDVIYAVEIWQAPACNYSGWNEPGHSLKRYVEFCHEVQEIIYEVAPSMMVLPASSDPEVNLAYFADLFHHHLFREDPDALGIQFYYNNEKCASRIFSDFHAGVNELRRMIKEVKQENHVPLIMTETGWPVDDRLSDGWKPGDAEMILEPGEGKRFGSINYDSVEAVDVFAQAHRMERVLYHANIQEFEAVFIQTIRDNVRPDGAHEHIWGDHCGLLDANLNPRPAYIAVKDFISRLREQSLGGDEV